ncbi:MAG: hypothetical protein GY842_10070 [bacterium]|nr:hypothetical protein [bacterium]
MGIFSVTIELEKPADPETVKRVDKIMVDTGSELSWVGSDRLREVGIEVRKKDQPFVMANGQTITRDLGYAIIRSGDFETIDEVVFAREGDLQLLGARTLEGFNATVDTHRKRLVAAGPMPAAGNRRPGNDAEQALQMLG